MDIYLVRHGDAERLSANVKDIERELTVRGIASIKKASEEWKNFIGEIDYIVASPLKRAVQTAEIIHNLLEIQNPVLHDKKLSPGNSTEFLLDIVQELDAESIIIVGHQPDLSMHLGNLISSTNSAFEFKKGTIAKISFNGKVRIGRGVLEFLIPAEVYK